MNFFATDLITYGIVFVVVFSLFYLLYSATMIISRGSIFDLFKGNKYEKLDNSADESYQFTDEGSVLGDKEDSKNGGFATDRIKDLVKNPPSGFEKYVRDKIEKLTNHKFPTVYPSWLTSGSNKFELDGYNKELGIAFETQGPQHYEFGKKYYKNYLDYYTRILHDQIKRKKCEKYGIALIIIDYSVPKHLLTYYIGSRLWDICREKALIDQSMSIEDSVGSVGSVGSTSTQSKKMPLSKVNCAALRSQPNCGIWCNYEKPAMYMEKITRTPYRNYELEKQMLLKGII